MQEKDANFVISHNPSYYTNETRYLDTFALSISPWKLTYLLTHITEPPCLLTTILTCLLNQLLTHWHTHLVKYTHTKFKFKIGAYQDITIYYYALSI